MYTNNIPIQPQLSTIKHRLNMIPTSIYISPSYFSYYPHKFLPVTLSIQKKLLPPSNIKNHYDINNNIMDMHDGNLLKVESLYYWYAMSYGPYREGNWLFNQVQHLLVFVMIIKLVYSSPDLMKWSKVASHILPDNRPVGIYFRPKVIYNAMTKKYILWINRMDWPSPYNYGHYLTATSDSPKGPFEIINSEVDMLEKRGINLILIYIFIKK